jgi:hypothetical protein
MSSTNLGKIIHGALAVTTENQHKMQEILSSRTPKSGFCFMLKIRFGLSPVLVQVNRFLFFRHWVIGCSSIYSMTLVDWNISQRKLLVHVYCVSSHLSH